MQNIQGTKTLWYSVMARANSTRDPPDIRKPHFQRCKVPLIWWPWWAFNPSDFYLSSVLGMERLQREGIIDREVKFVPVLDGLERMPFHEWFLSPFSDYKVPCQTMPLCKFWFKPFASSSSSEGESYP